MEDIRDLLTKKKEIDAALAKRKNEVIAAIVELMAASGVTLADLGAVPASAVKSPTPRPVRYRDENGNTWTGIGQRPRWLQKAMREGATLEQFAVRA